MYMSLDNKHKGKYGFEPKKRPDVQPKPASITLLEKKGRPSIRIRDISASNPRHPWIRSCTAPFEIISFLSRRNVDTKQSAGHDPWWNDHSP